MYIKAYKRPNGAFGIRNKVLIISTVGCANETAKRISEQVPDAVLIPNTKGCGQIGDIVNIMKRTLTGLVLNPNVYGVLIVGLGCETIQPYALSEMITARTSKPVKVLTIQEEGGTIRTIQKGVAIAAVMVREMSRQERVDADLSSITLATNCGGSDATSA
jgi:altronate dehydratase large subunit